MSDKEKNNQHAAIGASMDRMAASYRDAPERREVSRNELFVLCNLAFIGAQEMLRRVAPNDDMARRADANVAQFIDLIQSDGVENGVQDGMTAAVMIASAGMAMLNNQFREYLPAEDDSDVEGE